MGCGCARSAADGSQELPANLASTGVSSAQAPWQSSSQPHPNPNHRHHRPAQRRLHSIAGGHHRAGHQPCPRPWPSHRFLVAPNPRKVSSEPATQPCGLVALHLSLGLQSGQHPLLVVSLLPNTFNCRAGAAQNGSTAGSPCLEVWRGALRRAVWSPPSASCWRRQCKSLPWLWSLELH